MGWVYPGTTRLHKKPGVGNVVGAGAGGVPGDGDGGGGGGLGVNGGGERITWRFAKATPRSASTKNATFILFQIPAKDERIFPNE